MLVTSSDGVAIAYTVLGAGLSELWCPGDPDIQQLETEYVFYEDPLFARLRHTSYAGNSGTWNVEPFMPSFERIWSWV